MQSQFNVWNAGNLKASSEMLTANTVLVAGPPAQLSFDSSRGGCVSLQSFEERGGKKKMAELVLNSLQMTETTFED